MLTKNTSSVKKARGLLSQYMRPNVIKYVELDKTLRSHTKMIRYVITVNEEGLFALGVMRVGNKIDIYSTTYVPDVEVFDQRYFAEEKLDELVTQREQEGYEFCGDFDGDIVDVTKLRYQSVKPKGVRNTIFFNRFRDHANDYYCQLIPGGLHVLIKIDAFGRMAVQDFNNENVSINKDNLISGRVRSYLKPLMQKEGFRGALMEGYYDGKNVHIVDAGYLHNRSLFKLPFTKRISVINDLLASFEQVDGCSFIYPTTGNTNAWLNTYRFGLKKAALLKHRAGLFCVQPSSKYEAHAKIMQSGYLLTEGEHLQFMGNSVDRGELTLSNIDNMRESFHVPYPSNQSSVLANEYSVIGYNSILKDVPVIF